MIAEDTVYVDFGPADRLYHAGETVHAGSYQNVETGRTVCMDGDGELPPSFDGHVAAYIERHKCWGEVSGRKDGDADRHPLRGK
jgi:hypothetical protein